MRTLRRIRGSRWNIVLLLSLLLFTGLSIEPKTSEGFGMYPGVCGSLCMANLMASGGLGPFAGTPFMPGMYGPSTGQMPWTGMPMYGGGPMYGAGPMMMPGMMGMQGMQMQKLAMISDHFNRRGEWSFGGVVAPPVGLAAIGNSMGFDRTFGGVGMY